MTSCSIFSRWSNHHQANTSVPFYNWQADKALCQRKCNFPQEFDLLWKWINRGFFFLSKKSQRWKNGVYWDRLFWSTLLGICVGDERDNRTCEYLDNIRANYSWPLVGGGLGLEMWVSWWQALVRGSLDSFRYPLGSFRLIRERARGTQLSSV